jgi:hypothetical protein
MWLNTKGIRAGSIGKLSQENLMSGISKIIDEMDTFEARQKQVTIFQVVEKELWNLILNHLHPYWMSKGTAPVNLTFSPTASIKTKFAVQLPAQTRGQVVKDVNEEYKAGFTSRKRALAQLNPELNPEQIDELMQEIDEERRPTVAPAEN